MSRLGRKRPHCHRYIAFAGRRSCKNVVTGYGSRNCRLFRGIDRHRNAPASAVLDPQPLTGGELIISNQTLLLGSAPAFGDTNSERSRPQQSCSWARTGVSTGSLGQIIEPLYSATS